MSKFIALGWEQKPDYLVVICTMLSLNSLPLLTHVFPFSTVILIYILASRLKYNQNLSL